MNIAPDYRIIFDENNVILQYFDQREKSKKDGSVEMYEYQQNTFYPTVKTALIAFLNKTQRNCKTVEGLIERIEYVESLINKITEVPVR